MSFLVPEGQQAEETPAQKLPAGYGRLKSNPKAKARRGGTKFFDSADWATGKTSAPAQQAFPNVVEEESKPDNGQSPLAG